jgi:hypothetical protein
MLDVIIWNMLCFLISLFITRFDIVILLIVFFLNDSFHFENLLNLGFQVLQISTLVASILLRFGISILSIFTLCIASKASLFSTWLGCSWICVLLEIACHDGTTNTAVFFNCASPSWPGRGRVDTRRQWRRENDEFSVNPMWGKTVDLYTKTGIVNTMQTPKAVAQS